MNGKYISEKSISEMFNMSNKDAFDAINDWRNDWDDSGGPIVYFIEGSLREDINRFFALSRCLIMEHFFEGSALLRLW